MARTVRKTSGGAIGPIVAGTLLGPEDVAGRRCSRRNATADGTLSAQVARYAARASSPARSAQWAFSLSAGIGRLAIRWPARLEMSQTRAVASALAETTERPSMVKAMA